MRKVLVDTSIWIEHLRSPRLHLIALLEDTAVLGHPWVRGELALGRLADRGTVLSLLAQLPKAVLASDAEVMTMIEHHGLHDRGLGWVDAHLLAATLLTDRARLWSRDRRLHEVADELGVAFEPS